MTTASGDATQLTPADQSSNVRAARHTSATDDTAAHGQPASAADAVLDLQRTAGNAAVSQLLTSLPRTVEARSDGKGVDDLAPSEPPSLSLAGSLDEGMPDAASGEFQGDGAGGQIVAEGTRQEQEVLTHAEQSGQSLGDHVARQQARVQDAFDGHRTQIEAGIRTFQSSVAAQSTVHKTAVATSSAAARGRIAQQAISSREQTTNAIGELESEAGQHADAQSQRATDPAAVEQRVAATKPGTATGIAATASEGSGADREVVEGQQRIASTVASKARQELGRAGAQTAGHLRSGLTQLRTSLYGPAKGQAATQIDRGAQQATAAIEGGANVAAGTVSTIATHAREGAHAAHRSVGSALGAARDTAVADLAQWGRASKARITDAARRLGESLRRQAVALAAQVETTRAGDAAKSSAVAQVVAAVAEAGSKTRSGLSDQKDDFAAGGEVVAEGHLLAATNVGGDVDRRIAQAAEATSEAQQRATSAFGVHSDQASASAAGELAQAPARSSEKLRDPHDRAKADLTGVVDRSEATRDQWSESARRHGEHGASQFATEAQHATQSARERSAAPVQTVQRFLDSIIGPMRAWLQGHLGNVLGGIVSGIILAIPALIVAGVLIAAGPVGWVVLVGLLAVGIGLGIYGRFSEYQADHGHGPSFWQGVGLVVLGILDITGLPYLAEAGYGQRAFAPRPMSEFERWERGTQGVIYMALFFVGGGKRLFGTGVKPPVESGGPPIDRAPVPSVAGDGNAPVPVDRPVGPSRPGGERPQPRSVGARAHEPPSPALAAVQARIGARLTELLGRLQRVRAQAEQIPQAQPKRARILRELDGLDDELGRIESDLLSPESPATADADAIGARATSDGNVIEQELGRLQGEVNAAEVPIATPAERAMIDQYTAALSELSQARQSGDVAQANRARSTLDRIEGEAIREHNLPNSSRSRLLDHLNTLTERRGHVEQGQLSFPYQLANGTVVEGVGRPIDCQASRVGPLAGLSYAAILERIGFAPRRSGSTVLITDPATGQLRPDGATRLTWRFTDGSEIHIDVPGVENSSTFAVNRSPHIGRTAETPNNHLHLSDRGVGIVADSAPAHEPVPFDPDLRHAVNRGAQTSR